VSFQENAHVQKLCEVASSFRRKIALHLHPPPATPHKKVILVCPTSVVHKIASITLSRPTFVLHSSRGPSQGSEDFVPVEDAAARSELFRNAFEAGTAMSFRDRPFSPPTFLSDVFHRFA